MAPWDEALAIPVLANLPPDDQQDWFSWPIVFCSKNAWLHYRDLNWMR
jgi:hypothetical protein